jgi:hypothetical protein
MKSLKNQILILLLFILIPLISCGQTINFDKEKNYFSHNLDYHTFDVPVKYGCELYDDEVKKDSTSSIQELEFFDLGGISYPPLTPKFLSSTKFVLLYKGVPFSGKVLNYYSNGNKKWEQSYLDGLKNGDFIYYYESGKVQSKSQYKSDSKEGIFESFCVSGAYEKRTYKDDKLNGVWVGNYSDGRLFFKNFYLNGLLQSNPDSYNDKRITDGWKNIRYKMY